jgi:hypothetical protein
MADSKDIESDYRRQGLRDEENVELAAAEADALRSAQLFMLGRMRGIAMDMANALNRKAQALAFDGKFPGLGDVDPVLAFTRLSRSMLQMMAMEQQIMDWRHKQRRETRARRDRQRSEADTRRRNENEVKLLDAKPCPDIDRKPLAGLMTDIFKDVLKDPDFDGLSKRDIIARICAELRIEDPDLSIWPDEKADACAPISDAADGSDSPFPNAAQAALAGAQHPPAYTNGHDPP